MAILAASEALLNAVSQRDHVARSFVVQGKHAGQIDHGGSVRGITALNVAVVATHLAADVARRGLRRVVKDFTPHANLSAFACIGDVSLRERSRRGSTLRGRFSACRGIATAAGCQLAATCDLVVAAEDASFATPGVKIGLFCTTPMVPLVRAVPAKVAMEMLLTGAPISAERALAIGLVNRVVPPDGLDNAIVELTDAILASSSLTLRIGKAAFYDQLGLPEAEAYERAIGVMTDNALRRDAQEGMSAFLQKRRPGWVGA